jgi:hypothetical protein
VAPLEKMEVRLSHRHLLSVAVQEEKGGVLAHERSPRTDLPEDATRRNAREEAPTQTADDHSRQGLEVQESRDNPILRLRSRRRECLSFERGGRRRREIRGTVQTRHREETREEVEEPDARERQFAR